MTDFNASQIKAIETAGFKLDTAGKVRNSEGKLVKGETVEHIIAGSIVANVNFDDLRKAKARKAAGGGTDLLTSLRAISPAIEKIQVGQTARIPMPKEKVDGKDPKRSFVMGVVTKLNNLTQAGREWAGRKFDTMSDPDGDFLFVARLPDGEAVARKPGGGRKSKVALAAALEKTAEALGEKPEETKEALVAEAGSEAKVEEEAQAPVEQEEAMVVNH